MPRPIDTQLGPIRQLYVSDWALDWFATRLRLGLRVWVLIAVETVSERCRILRAHHSRESSCIVADLESVSRGHGNTPQVLHLPGFDPSHLSDRLKYWAMLQGVALEYSRASLSAGGRALERYVHRIENELLGKVKPRSLTELNNALTAFRNQM